MSNNELAQYAKYYHDKFKRLQMNFASFMLAHLFAGLAVFMIELGINTDWVFDTVVLTGSIGTSLFVVCLWYLYIKQSKLQEKLQEVHKEDLKKKEEAVKEEYRDIIINGKKVEIRWFDHKKSRRDISLLYFLILVINFINITIRLI